MFSTPNKVFLFIMFNVLLLGQGKEIETSRKGRDFQGYLPPEDHKNPDYQVFQYPNNFLYKEEYAECAKNPMLPLLGKGLNLLLLKLGVFGIIKAVIALLFLGILVKVPFILLKIAFLKSFFLPVLLIPLFLHAYSSHVHTSTDSTPADKPGETPTEMAGIMGMGEMAAEMGRRLQNNFPSVALKSMKMIAETDQCIERISCMVGASSKDSYMANIFARILKNFYHSGPPAVKERMTSIKEAFGKGLKTSTCLESDYICRSPELLLQYGTRKIKIL